MVLLIQEKKRLLITGQQTLHSNMVLLIPRQPQLAVCDTGPFTFQYGSINTVLIPAIFPDAISLHSNMVLLIPRHWQPHTTCNISLHSNMVLLIQLIHLPRNAKTISLHSNMVLLILVFHKFLSHKHYSTTFCRPCHFLFFRDP